MSFGVLALAAVASAVAMQPSRVGSSAMRSTPIMSSAPTPPAPAVDPCTLPGDPSLILSTNIDLGSEKVAFMQQCSKAIVAATGKPESYVAVCVNDKLDLIWGGEPTPCALGVLYSIGSIGKESNGKLMAQLSALLEPLGVPKDRIYVNFFDVPRENVGWNGATFAG